MRDKEKEKEEMKFSYETSDGYKSIDRKIKKLIAYVNDRVDLWMQIEAHKLNIIILQSLKMLSLSGQLKQSDAA